MQKTFFTASNVVDMLTSADGFMLDVQAVYFVVTFEKALAMFPTMALVKGVNGGQTAIPEAVIPKHVKQFS
jgi:hypothetical protein